MVGGIWKVHGGIWIVAGGIWKLASGVWKLVCGVQKITGGKVAKSWGDLAGGAFVCSLNVIVDTNDVACC